MEEQSLLTKIYVDTILQARELLHPYQMDNDITNHIKNNLIKHYEKKCFKEYGFINKIYRINEINETKINPEDIQSGQQYNVKFSCQLFYVVKDREIICKMDKINEKISTAINGPVKVIIPPDLIDYNHFFVDSNKILRIKKTTELLKPNTYVKILIKGVIFSDKDKEITTKGILLNLATEEEVKNYYTYENKEERFDVI